MFTKLENGQEYQNENFPAAFAEYLIQNKWRMTPAKSDISFIKGKFQIRIKGTALDFFKFNDDPTIQKWDFVSSFTGIDTIADVNMFVLLLHSASIQDMREFMNNAADISHQHWTQAKLFINSLLMILTNQRVVNGDKT